MTLHTSVGDLKVEVYCEEVPRTAENFLALCASGYYDGTKFHRRARFAAVRQHRRSCSPRVAHAHRNIKGFMVQGGDPTGAQRFAAWGRGG